MEVLWKYTTRYYHGIRMDVSWKTNSYPVYTLHLRNLPSVGKDEVNNHPKLLYCSLLHHVRILHTTPYIVSLVGTPTSP